MVQKLGNWNCLINSGIILLNFVGGIKTGWLRNLGGTEKCYSGVCWKQGREIWKIKITGVVLLSMRWKSRYSKCQSQICCQFLVLDGKVSFVNELFTYYIGGPTNGNQRWQTPVGWICWIRWKSWPHGIPHRWFFLAKKTNGQLSYYAKNTNTPNYLYNEA